MPPRPVEIAVSRSGQVAHGNVGAGIVLPHEQGKVAFVRSVKEYDCESQGIVFELKSRFNVLGVVKPLHERFSFVLGNWSYRKDYRIYGNASIGTGKQACTIRSNIPSSRCSGA